MLGAIFSWTLVSPSDTIWEQRMSSKHDRTLEAIFETPVRANIPWREIEKLLVWLGAVIKEGSGSRIHVSLNGVRATFHRPHPQKETDKGAVVDVRDFLTEAGVEP